MNKKSTAVISRTLMFLAHASVASAAATSCVLPSPLNGVCNSICNGCGQTTCMDIDIFGFDLDQFTLEDRLLINVTNSYVNSGACQFKGYPSVWPESEATGHPAYQRFLKTVYEECTEDPTKKMVTVPVTENGTTIDVTHPCCIQQNYDEVSEELIPSVEPFSSCISSASVNTPSLAGFREGMFKGKECDMLTSKTVTANMFTYLFRPQMAMIPLLISKYGIEAMALMFAQSFTPEQQAAALAATGLANFTDVMIQVVTFMQNVDSMVDLMNEALEKGWEHCIEHENEKYFNAFAVEMGNKTAEWTLLSSVMLASSVSSDWVSLKKGEANKCRMSEGNVQRATVVYNEYYASNQTVLLQPCFMDADNFVRSAKELKDQIIDNYKVMIFDGDDYDSYQGCFHYFCKDGKRSFDPVNDQFNYYMKGNYHDLIALNKTGHLAEELKGYVTLGVSPETLPFIPIVLEAPFNFSHPSDGKQSKCSTIKSSYHTNECCPHSR